MVWFACAVNVTAKHRTITARDVLKTFPAKTKAQRDAKESYDFAFLCVFLYAFAPLRETFHSQRMKDCVLRAPVSTILGAQTLTQPTVTSMLMRAFQNQSANLKRGLGLLLLVFIFYGTTVEAAHRHGRVGPPVK